MLQRSELNESCCTLVLVEKSSPPHRPLTCRSVLYRFTADEGLTRLINTLDEARAFEFVDKAVIDDRFRSHGCQFRID